MPYEEPNLELINIRKYFPIIIGIVAAVIIIGVVLYEPPKTVPELKAEILESVHAGDYDDAIKTLNELKQKPIAQLEVELLRGDVLMVVARDTLANSGDTDESAYLEAFAHYFDLAEKHPDCQKCFAGLIYSDKLSMIAEDYSDIELLLTPELLEKRGWIYQQNDEIGLAILTYDKILTIDDLHYNAYVQKGKLLIRDKNYDDALTHLKLALEKFPDSEEFKKLLNETEEILAS